MHALLQDLAALHDERDRRGSSNVFAGDPDRTVEVLQRHLDPLEPRDVIAWLKKRP
jgi:hypothetical protein